jgi:hypothetical protein
MTQVPYALGICAPMAYAVPSSELLLLQSHIELWKAKLNAIVSENAVCKLHYSAAVMFDEEK